VTTSDNIIRVRAALGGRAAWIYVGQGRKTWGAGLTLRPLRVMNTYFAPFERHAVLAVTRHCHSSGATQAYKFYW